MSATASQFVKKSPVGIDYHRLSVPTCLLGEGDEIAWSNPAFDALFGASPATQRITDLLAPDERGRFLTLLANGFSGCCERFEFSGEAAEPRNLMLTLAPAPDALGTMMQLYPLASAQSQAPAVEHRLRDLIEAASDWFWETDAEMRFTYVSPRIEKITGLRVSEIIGKTWMEVAATEIEPAELQRYRDDVANHRPFNNIIYKQTFAKGYVRYLRIRGRPIFPDLGFGGYRGVGTDITREKDAELRAYRAQQRFYHAIDNVGQGIAVFDAEGHLVACNARYSELHRRPTDPRPMPPRLSYREVMRARFASGFFVPPRGDIETFIDKRVEQAASGEADYSYELHDGRWIQDSLRVMPDGGCVSLLTDITAARENQHRREFLEQQLLRSQRLESLGRLAAGLANDLNNALVPITVFGKRVAGKTGDERDRSLVQAMLDSAARVHGLVKQILAFTGVEESDKATIQLRPLVTQTLALLRASLPPAISIETRLEDVPPVFGDANQLHQVVTNVFGNAVQAIGERPGTITVSLTNSPNSDGTVMLVLSDDGPGMDEETRRRIFEAFFTTNHAEDSTGLGLWVVYEIVTNHGGQIEVKSTPGAGTTFEITLPAARRSLIALTGSAQRSTAAAK